MSDRILVFPEEQIAARVRELGARARADYERILAPGEQLLAIGVLNGAFIFMADLVRAMGGLPVEVDFVRLSSYQDRDTSSSEVVMTKNIEKDIKGRHVLVVEDIADAGLTLDWLIEFLNKRGPASLRIAVVVDKLARRETRVPLDYVGFTLHDGFLIGYGLDFAERYRALPAIYELATR
ncbi:MAG: hypoxanthine phosphoribosyltransferase [Planctomycetota bacterium]|jgi:hypoxanthine phosphoribosyltransferase|nr:hypoxanthine phosphoribosyltransferase [Planctomycetota bacterium]